MSEKAFNEISPLLKMRCKLSYYWHSLSIDHRDLFSELIKNKDKLEVKKMKNTKKTRLEDEIVYKYECETPTTIEQMVAFDEDLINEPIIQFAIERIQKEIY